MQKFDKLFDGNLNLKDKGQNYYYQRIVELKNQKAKKLSGKTKVDAILNGTIFIGLVVQNGKDIHIVIGGGPRSADSEYHNNYLSLKMIRKRLENNEDIPYAESYYRQHKHTITSPLQYTDTIYVILMYVYYNYKKGESDVLKTFENIYDLKHVRDSDTFFVSETSKIELDLSLKLLPLSISDIKNIQTISQTFQKELYINLQLRLLIINFVCIGFSALVDYTVFKRNDSAIFSNPIFKKRIDASEKYLKKIKLLYSAGKFTDREFEDNYEILENFRNKIYEPINFAEKHLLFSKYCFILIFEKFRSSLYDELKIAIKYIEEQVIKHRNFTSSHRLLNDIEVFKTHAIQIIYALYCLNLHVKCIHGDLHLNNVVVNFFSYPHNVSFKIDDTYFNFESFHLPVIIDFGRSVLNIPLTEEETYLQIKKLKALFYKMLPDFYSDNEKKIDRIFRFYPNEIFRILTSLDTIYYLRVFCDFYENIHIDITRFCNKIIFYLIEFITTSVSKLVSGSSENIDYPNRLVLFEFFEKSSKPVDEPFIYCDHRAKIQIDIKNGEFVEPSDHLPVYHDLHREYDAYLKHESLNFTN